MSTITYTNTNKYSYLILTQSTCYNYSTQTEKSDAPSPPKRTKTITTLNDEITTTQNVRPQKLIPNNIIAEQAKSLATPNVPNLRAEEDLKVKAMEEAAKTMCKSLNKNSPHPKLS